jgi:serine phosphatase RsbU (regulator of sigma subunit)
MNLNSTWKQISGSGLQYCKTPHDRKTVVLLNKISTICALTMILFLAFCAFFTNGTLLPFVFFFGIVFGSLPLIHSYGFLKLGKVLGCIIPVCIISFISLVSLREGGDRYYLLVTAVIPLILFKNRWAYILFFDLNVAVFLFLDWFQRNYEPLMDIGMKDIYAYYIINFITIFFMLFVILHYFLGTNNEYEKELQQANHVLDEKNKEVTDSINYAKRIQYALLAHDDFLKTHIPDHFVLFHPKDIVSGDFYWSTHTKTLSDSDHPGNFYLAVCDSTGHGVPGAFMSLLNISYLNEAINEKKIHEPDKVLNHVRERLVKNISSGSMQDGMDAILICMNGTPGKITYAAAHNAPVLVRNNELMEFSADKMPVGKGMKEDPFRLMEINVQKGDVLYLYTDGFADQFGGDKGKKFKDANLKKLLLEIHSRPCDEQKNILLKGFESWKGALEQIDDVCIIGIRM